MAFRTFVVPSARSGAGPATGSCSELVTVADAGCSWIGLPSDTCYLTIPIKFDSVLILFLDMVFNALANPFVGVNVFGFRRVVLADSVVHFNVPIHHLSVSPLLEKDIVQSCLSRALLKIHSFDYKVK